MPTEKPQTSKSTKCALPWFRSNRPLFLSLADPHGFLAESKLESRQARWVLQPRGCGVVASSGRAEGSRSLSQGLAFRAFHLIFKFRLSYSCRKFDMCFAWNYAEHMATMVQIRNVPTDLHRELKARAALEGLSLSDYLLREIRQVLERPTIEELRKRLSGRRPVRPRPAPAAAVRAERTRR
jgi:antitoxin FitA